MAKTDLTAEMARALVSYDPETGSFTSLAGGGRFHRGGKIGAADGCGYVRIYISNRYYRAHRVAWLWMTGAWPTIIDHINGNRRDNRWCNLREASVLVNNQNLQGARAQSLSGVLGVSQARSGRFTATIGTHLAGRKVQLYLGSYESHEIASAVYLDAKRRLHEGCTI